MESYASGSNSISTSTPYATKGKMEFGAGTHPDVVINEATGDVTLGTGTETAAATAGFLFIPSVATDPTGAPTPQTGFVPIVFSIASSKLCVYNGTSWVKTSALS